MREVVLNYECAHCEQKECHDGEHFCNQAMKENSFYKNAKLYKGLEVIQRPTYCELEKENAKLKAIVRNTKAVDESFAKLQQENAELRKELKEWKDEWQEQVQKANDEGYTRTLQTIQLKKAKEIIKNLLILKNDLYGNTKMEWRIKVTEQAEQFLSEVEK
jgi:glutamine synthetase adenylyltransferase